MNNLMEEVIGEVQVELDGRFSSMRTKETNLGELPVDALLFGETTCLFHFQTLTFNFLHSYRTHLPLDAVLTHLNEVIFGIYARDTFVSKFYIFKLKSLWQIICKNVCDTETCFRSNYSSLLLI